MDLIEGNKYHPLWLILKPDHLKGDDHFNISPSVVGFVDVLSVNNCAAVIPNYCNWMDNQKKLQKFSILVNFVALKTNKLRHKTTTNIQKLSQRLKKGMLHYVGGHITQLIIDCIDLLLLVKGSTVQL